MKRFNIAYMLAIAAIGAAASLAGGPAAIAQHPCFNGDPPCITGISEGIVRGRRVLIVSWAGNGRFSHYNLRGVPGDQVELPGSN